MKAKILNLMCVGLLLWNLSLLANENRIPKRARPLKHSSNMIAVFITDDSRFLIFDNANNRVLKANSSYQFFRKLSFVTKESSVQNIPIYAEGKNSAMNYFDELLKDSTIINEMTYETSGDELFVRTRFLEHPSRNLTFKVCL